MKGEMSVASQPKRRCKRRLRSSANLAACVAANRFAAPSRESAVMMQSTNSTQTYVRPQSMLCKDVFHAAEQGAPLRFVVHLRERVEFFQKLALPLRKLCRRLHADFDEDVASAMTIHRGHAFTA